MTAFEILLNKFYDTIEKNEPKTTSEKAHIKSNELFQLIRYFVDTSFSHGHNLDYKNTLQAILEKAANLLQNTSHEEWAKVKSAFMENDLHIIRRDRDHVELENLKMRLESSF